MIPNETDEELRNQGHRTLYELLHMMETALHRKIDIQVLIKIRETMPVTPKFKELHTYYSQDDQEKMALAYIVSYNGNS